MLVTSSSATASGVIAKSEAFWIAMVEPSGSAEASSRGGQRAVGAGLVDHREGRAELVAEALGHGAADQVGWTRRRPAPTYISTVPEG